METERERNIRRIYELLDARPEPGFGVVISLSDEKKKREARAAAKRARRLAQVAGRKPNKPSGGRNEKE